MAGYASLYDSRSQYSRDRLDELRRRLARLEELRSFPDLAIFGAGSYGRLEASPYSDLDVFFLTSGDGANLQEPRTNKFRMFGKVIDVADAMSFPKFSNDSEYLVILHTPQMLSHLGGRVDDHENYFTARMLLLLESRCIYGDEAFREIVRQIVNSYFKDFPDHTQTFQPMFLMNDICRFWKTLLLNYENKRNYRSGTTGALTVDEAQKTRQKVKNFKLKYSRMTTCYASVAALGSYTAPVTEEQVIAITEMTPRERLQSVADRIPDARAAVDDVLSRYAWFLEMTGQTTADLEAHFSDKAKRTEMFGKANDYGNAMYQLLRTVDDTDTRLRLLRTLVI